MEQLPCYILSGGVKFSVEETPNQGYYVLLTFPNSAFWIWAKEIKTVKKAFRILCAVLVKFVGNNKKEFDNIIRWKLSHHFCFFYFL